MFDKQKIKNKDKYIGEQQSRPFNERVTLKGLLNNTSKIQQVYIKCPTGNGKYPSKNTM